LPAQRPSGFPEAGPFLFGGHQAGPTALPLPLRVAVAERQRAVEHLGFVVPERETVKMASALERARMVQQRLGQPDSAAAGRAPGPGVPVWFDWRSIAGGSSWDHEIVRGIKANGVVAGLVGPAAMPGKNV
jgi:hypothetical protein